MSLARARARPRSATAELPYALLARVRRSLRVLNAAIERGATQADLTVQQQAFLLALAARGGRRVPLGQIRGELDMDQATASELLARLVGLGLVEREAIVRVGSGYGLIVSVVVAVVVGWLGESRAALQRERRRLASLISQREEDARLLVQEITNPLRSIELAAQVLAGEVAGTT